MKKINFIKYICYAALASLASCQDDDIADVGDLEDPSGPAPFFSIINQSDIGFGCDGVVGEAEYEFQFLSGDQLAVNGTDYAWEISPTDNVNYVDVETRATLESLESQIVALRGEAANLENAIAQEQFNLPCSLDAVATQGLIDTAQMELVTALEALDVAPVDEDGASLPTANEQIADLQEQIDGIIASQIALGFLEDNPTEIPIALATLDEQDITIAFPDPDTYSVALTVTDNLEASETLEQEVAIAVPVDVEPLSITQFSSVPVSGTSVQFTNESGGATGFVWDFGDGTTSTEESPIHEFAEEGIFTITFTTTNIDGISSPSVVRSISVGGVQATFAAVILNGDAEMFIWNQGNDQMGNMITVLDPTRGDEGRLYDNDQDNADFFNLTPSSMVISNDPNIGLIPSPIEDRFQARPLRTWIEDNVCDDSVNPGTTSGSRVNNGRYAFILDDSSRRMYQPFNVEVGVTYTISLAVRIETAETTLELRILNDPEMGDEMDLDGNSETITSDSGSGSAFRVEGGDDTYSMHTFTFQATTTEVAFYGIPTSTVAGTGPGIDSCSFDDDEIFIDDISISTPGF